MKIDIMTLFPEMCENILMTSIIGRAIKKKVLNISFHQIRDFASDKHKRVDDAPYGGGCGMLLLAEPIAACFENVCKMRGERPHLIFLSPKGQVLNQKIINKIVKNPNIALLCGHYEGVDQRVIDEFVDEQISIGDYVLTGGEIPAMVLIDAVARALPGVLSSEECFKNESHYNGLLEAPQYTKPQVWRGLSVPEVLISGHHKNIEDWKFEQSLLETQKYRPDLLENLIKKPPKL